MLQVGVVGMADHGFVSSDEDSYSSRNWTGYEELNIKICLTHLNMTNAQTVNGQSLENFCGC
jgi:hypothetical protein